MHYHHHLTPLRWARADTRAGRSPNTWHVIRRSVCTLRISWIAASHRRKFWGWQSDHFDQEPTSRNLWQALVAKARAGIAHTRKRCV